MRASTKVLAFSALLLLALTGCRAAAEFFGASLWTSARDPSHGKTSAQHSYELHQAMRDGGTVSWP